MSEKIIKINDEQFQAITEVINHIYGGTYENLFSDEMLEENEIQFDDDGLAEQLDKIAAKYLKASDVKNLTSNIDCWYCRAPVDFCSCEGGPR